MKSFARAPFAILLVISSSAHAGPPGDYTLTTDTLDAGGNRATHAGAGYTNDGSLGGMAGLSTVASPAETVKAGYIGQLYETTGFALAAAGTDVNAENATLQLAGVQTLDDSTLLAVPAIDVNWSVQSGPLAGIDAGGLATAGTAYQDTAAIARGEFAGFAATLGLTVIDSIPDNSGSYAGDGLGDDWQVQYFGVNNPDAAPGLDPDGDGQNNRFEFIAGLIPTDPLSRFLLRIEPVPNEGGKKRLIFSPVLADRTYSVEFGDSLVPASWTTLTVPVPIDNGNERTVTDTSATAPRRFYQIKVEKP